MTDTSKEAVERLARHVADLPHQAATTLRSILAERDAARAETGAVAEYALQCVLEADSLELATHGANKIAERIRALTPADAISHLKAIETKAEARGMREAAKLSDPTSYQAHHAAVRRRVRDAILALADEREKGTVHD